MLIGFRYTNYKLPSLLLLREMKEGLDIVTIKVKANNYPIADGISYLEAKHLLLLNYCQSLVYYLLRKAKGFSINGHLVVRSLVDIRLFLEKVWASVSIDSHLFLLQHIRPINKKLQYQVEKLTKDTSSTTEDVGPRGNEPQSSVPWQTDDLLKYHPNPEMLVSKTDVNSKDHNDVYRPPKFAPTSMEEDKLSKQDKNRDEREQQEEVFFTHYSELVSLRLLGLTDNFYDEIKGLPLDDENDDTRYIM
ncbi:unnamed protein product [Malus baccata var. baccata]